jgi:predicted transcriptional regulator of viral defense system
MAKILNWDKLQKAITDKKLLIFRPKDISCIFGVSEVAARFFVYRYSKKGTLIRLKKDQKGSLYALADSMPSQYLIDNKIYEPSYISFDTALSYHGIIPESIYSITSATVKATRSFTVANVLYKYFRIKKEVFTGYKLIKYRNNTILMADPEKALADYLYFISLNKRDLHYERINIKKLNRRKLKQYMLLYQHPKMAELFKEIYANRRKSAGIY